MDFDKSCVQSGHKNYTYGRTASGCNFPNFTNKGNHFSNQLLSTISLQTCVIFLVTVIIAGINLSAICETVDY